MTRNFQTSTDVGGEGNAITKPGTYHCDVANGRDGESTNGKSINGCSAVLTALAGTEADQVGHEFHLHLFDPDLSKSDKAQEMASKKQTAYGVAINQIEPSKLGQALDVDFGAGADGQQIIITLTENEYDGKVNLQVHFANIYHVDDPRAEKFPKNQEALGYIDASNRKTAEYFTPLTAKKGSNGSANGSDGSASNLSQEQLADL